MMRQQYTRRAWLGRAAWTSVVALAGAGGCGRSDSSRVADATDNQLERETFDFIDRCRREDGSYAPSPDPAYAGNSDTKLSDLAAVTYAAVLAKSLGRELPHAEGSAAFLHDHQQPDGSFINRAGKLDPT